MKGTCCGVRNLSDDRIRAIAAHGGVVGIGMFDLAVCGECIEDTVRAIRYTVDLVGAEHVAVGSDWDGATIARACTDASGAHMPISPLIATV